ncbi:MAG: hypothetical protein NTY19_18965 [Planctomycetota bacterium]|nr:hypothetical protein [Planctomycetota bacterium]
MTAVWRTLLVATTLLTGASVSPCLLHAEDEPLFARPSDAVVAKGNEILERVNSETKANAQELNAWPWPGQYYAGDGIGFNLRLAIAPKAGVVYWCDSDLGGLYELNYGSFREKDGYIHLTFDKKGVKDTGSAEGLHPVLVPIRWGDRRYLIPENEMIDFCNHINSGSQNVSRAARFLRHVDDRDKKTAGIPKVPPRYQTYLLKEPVDAEVTWIGKTVILERKDRWPPGKHRVTKVRLNRGKGDGLLPGMELFHPKFPDLRVLDVTASTCHAETSECLLAKEATDTDDAKMPQIRLGLRYSTRASDSSEDGSAKE